MIPSKAWFPQSLQERVAWFMNFATNFSGEAVGLGFPPADVTSVENDNFVMQAIGDYTTSLEAYKDGFRQYRLTITEGDIGDPTPSVPDAPSWPDVSAVPTGIYERLVKLVDRIRVAPTYTPEIGATLGILPKSPGDNLVPGQMKPVLKASASEMNYTFTVDVTRLGMPGYSVQILRQGGSVWTTVALANANPCPVTVTPATPGQPERIQVRAILSKNNQDVGIPSDATYVTVNP